MASTQKTHRKLEALMAEMNDDVDLPRNYNLMYTILGKRVPVTTGPLYYELIEEVGGGTYIALFQNQSMVFNMQLIHFNFISRAE